MSLWFGYEWEIAASAMNRDGEVVPIPEVLDGVSSLVVEQLKHVDGERNGCWLESGGLFYRDASDGGQAHNEYASPECDHPDELLRQSNAADRMMLHLAGLLKERVGYGKVMISKSNVSHASAQSWGVHENYEASNPVPTDPMLAWLAARILLTGSGGLDVTYPGIRFSLSPRAHFFEVPVSHNTQCGRGLHNVGKACPYGKRHRVHVISGDGNRADLSNWLKFGCTALVVRMLDAGKLPEIGLVDPVRAIKTFALDVNLDAKVECSDGSEAGIMKIQRWFLESAAAATGLFPDWAPRVIDEWGRVLDRFESGGGWVSLTDQLDWPAKRALFERVVERSGWTWERIGEVNARIDDVYLKLGDLSPTDFVGHIDSQNPFSEMVLRLVGDEMDNRLFEEFRELRQQLSVVDARYMELGEDSLHDRICRPLNGNSPFAIQLPENPLDLPAPPTGRAGVRAGLVSKLGWKSHRNPSNPEGTFATWTKFVADGKELAMPDVDGVPDLDWKPVDGNHTSSRRGRDVSAAAPVFFESVRAAVGRANAAVDAGEYEAGFAALQGVRHLVDSQEIHPGLASHYWQFMVRVQARRQREDELTEAVGKLEAAEFDHMEFLWDSCNAHCHIGLAGHPAVRGLCEKVSRELESWLFPRTSGIACWKYHVARWHNRNCRGAEALGLLEPTLVTGAFEVTTQSVQVGILSQLGDARRMIGDLDGAERLFTEAETICRGSELSANLWDLVMTGRARLLLAQGRREESYKLLAEEIMPAQRRLGMPGWLRSKILMERISTEHGNRLRRHRTRKSLALDVSHFSGYARCPLMTRVLDHWNEWCEGGPDPEPPVDAEFNDDLWGV